MRIGLVVPGFSANADDWCIPALRHLARALAAQDEVRVVAVRYPYRASRYTVDGAEVIALGGAARRGSSAAGVWGATLAVLRSEHRRRPFDVLHAFWATESGLLTALAGQVLRVPTVVSLAGGELVALPEIGYGDQRVAWERLKIRASLRLASAVTAGSVLLMALAAGHVASQRLHRAPLGVDLDLFKPGPDADAGRFSAPAGDTLPHAAYQRTSAVAVFQGTFADAAIQDTLADAAIQDTLADAAIQGTSANAARQRDFPDAARHGDLPDAAGETLPAADGRVARLVHVATLTPIKDQATLLRAFAMARQRLRNTTLDIVGDGPLRPRLEHLARELGVAQAVRFSGSVDHAALPDIYRGASAFVLSSRHEAQGMVAIEAAACGIPVVGTRVGVIPELAAAPEAVAPVGAVAALAAALVAACVEPRPGTQRVQARIRTEFGLEACVNRFRALYAAVGA